MSEKQKNKKLIIIVSIAFVVIVGITVSVIAMIAGHETVDDILALGDKYMTELDYESAIREYKRAIEVDPMCVEAYLKLADAYLEIGDRDSAISTLENGYDVTGDDRILEKLSELRENDAEPVIKETITLDANGGNISDTSMTVTVGSTYGELPALTRPGYTFKGWYTEQKGGTRITETTPVTETPEQTLYAQWSVNTYTVTFEADDGSVSPSSITVTYDSTYGRLPTPTRKGYTFDGWYTEKNGGTEITKSTPVTVPSAQTLYAHWKANTYTVTFNTNGGNESSSKATVTYGSPYGTMPTPTKTGHTFSGWFTEKSGGAEITESTLVSIASNQTLYAQWSASVYTIILDANGGTVSPGSVTATYDSACGNLPTPTRTGYIFLGWFSEVNGGQQIKPTTKLRITSDQTFYAHWEEFVPDESTVLLSSGQTVTHSFPVSNVDGMAQMYRTWDVVFTVVLQEPGNLTVELTIPRSTAVLANLWLQVNNGNEGLRDSSFDVGLNTKTYYCEAGIYRFRLEHFVAPAIKIDRNLDITLSFIADTPNG